jgi:hypothetical protein
VFAKFNLAHRLTRIEKGVPLTLPLFRSAMLRLAVHPQFSAAGACHFRNGRLSIERSNLEERDARQDWP